MKCKCKSCGHEWLARSKMPPMCPKCHVTKWNGDEPPPADTEPPVLYKCLRCKREWTPRGTGMPKACPSCHTTLWNTPRVRKASKTFKAKKQTEPRKRTHPYTR